MANLSLAVSPTGLTLLSAPLLDALKSRKFTEDACAEIEHHFVDLVNGGNAFKLIAVPTGSASELLVHFTPTDEYLAFCAAIRAGDFDARGV